MNTLERILALAERDLDQTVKLLSLTRKLTIKPPSTGAETVGPQKSSIVCEGDLFETPWPGTEHSEQAPSPPPNPQTVVDVSGPDAGKLGFGKAPAVGDIIPLYTAEDARKLLNHTIRYAYFEKREPGSTATYQCRLLLTSGYANTIVVKHVTGKGEDFHCNTGSAARRGTEDDGIPWAYVVALPPEVGQWYVVGGKKCMFAQGAYHPVDGGEPEELPVAATPCEAPAFDVAGYHVYVGPEGIEVRDNGMLFEGPVRSLEQLTCLRDALFSDDESAMDRIEHLAGLLA